MAGNNMLQSFMTNTGAFPWLSLNSTKEIKDRSKNMSGNSFEQMLLQDDMYSKELTKKKHEDFVKERQNWRMQLKERAKDTKDEKQKNTNNSMDRLWVLADIYRQYGYEHGKDRDSIPDDELVSRFNSKNPQAKKYADSFLTWNGDSEYELARNLWIVGTPRKNAETETTGETWLQKAADVGVWILQSPWKRGYNMIWQWADKWAEKLKELTEDTKVGNWLTEQSTNAIKWVLKKKWLSDEEIEKEINAYVEQRDKELAEWTAFNGREATDIRTPLLWEERANSKYTKAWEVVGDIGTAIAMSAPLSSALAPAMAWGTLWEAALLWGIEWWIDTLVTHYGSQWNLDVTPTEAALWIVGGAGWWMLTNKLSKVANNVDDVANNVDDATKNAKITTKIADKTDDAKKVAGRIWQWDIDDQAKVVEWVKSITKRSWEKWVKTIKKYGELKDAIKSTEKQIISQEDDLLRQFPDKITDWTTTETVRWLGDQVDDVTRDYLDDWIELLKKYNKNDPVAMKELEMLQNTKNTEWLTRLEAKELARKLWAKLSKKFYNSNDELRNSMSAESYEQIRKWIQNAVRDRLPDDVLKNLDLEYSNLKAFEWLTDDMAEKVNTLTQKLKETWPIEKLGRKVWDVINFVTGKGIKWVVEKFLPSNMWNKINNSIDMEIELSKNLSKLVDLNKAIDTLNATLNSSASKSAINTALRNFANTVNGIVPVTVATSNVVYNNTLDK